MRLLALAVSLFFAAALAAAQAHVGMRVTTTDVRVGGTIRGKGFGAAPVYLVPESRAHRPYPCAKPRGRGYCYPLFFRPPRRPYVLIGRLRGEPDSHQFRPFVARVPAVAPGRYQVALWCKPCRPGNLFLAGDSLYGQVITVRR